MEGDGCAMRVCRAHGMWSGRVQCMERMHAGIGRKTSSQGSYEGILPESAVKSRLSSLCGPAPRTRHRGTASARPRTRTRKTSSQSSFRGDLPEDAVESTFSSSCGSTVQRMGAKRHLEAVQRPICQRARLKVRSRTHMGQRCKAASVGTRDVATRLGTQLQSLSHSRPHGSRNRRVTITQYAILASAQPCNARTRHERFTEAMWMRTCVRRPNQPPRFA